MTLEPLYVGLPWQMRGISHDVVAKLDGLFDRLFHAGGY
jgi:hypothetical protein